MRRRRIHVRCGALGLATTAGLGAALATLGPGVHAPSHDVAAAITRCCTLVLLAGLAWGWAAVLAGVVDAWGRADDRTTPSAPSRELGALRRFVLALCGVALTGALAGALVGPAAQAAPSPGWTAAAPPVAGAAAGAVAGAPVPDQLPDDPLDSSPRAAGARASTTSAAPAVLLPAPVMVVQPGDCLWDLAESQVQPGAGPITVTARWHAIYAANREAIGDNPDLIRPGQQLRQPR